MQFSLVITTYPNREEAKVLASSLLEQKLAACIQLNEIQSYYLWEDKIQNDPEIRVVIKAKKSNFHLIVEVITSHHSYEIPQIIEIPVTDGYKPYLDWIEQI